MMRCPYPRCFREEHEDGDHQLGRPPQPSGVITVVQEFSISRSPIPCDLQPDEKPRSHSPALGFYVDELGFGWQLCYCCVRGMSIEDLFPAVKSKVVKMPARRRRRDRELPKKAAIIRFERRAR